MRRKWNQRILGAVVAGGRSRRFGSDKALAEFEGLTLLDHAIAGLSRQCDAVVVCGREIPGIICLADRPASDLGPLGGLAAALQHAAANGFSAVLTSACDTPEVPASLAQSLAGDAPAVVLGQPLFGYWPASFANELDFYLANASSLAVSDWIAWTGARRVRLPDTIANINTPADLTALRFRRFLPA
jgi:molybdopterin-guanine dinucleotide biosynthesis protein A